MSAPRRDATTVAPLLVSPPEACRILGGCSDTHLRRLTAAGKVTIKYDGRLRRVVYSSLVAYVDSLTEDPAVSA